MVVTYKHDNTNMIILHTVAVNAPFFEGGAHTVSFVHGPMLTNVPESNSG